MRKIREKVKLFGYYKSLIKSLGIIRDECNSKAYCTDCPLYMSKNGDSFCCLDLIGTNTSFNILNNPKVINNKYRVVE